ncbi:uncharacterized protein BYT42DRAFT_326057 [Radiomyces spectabilis]|uniref:uncharacterized protein n=1 Tax=Radiomyces spectabilis TaxID=64574 RepID=UPI00221F2D07|nr:uncharacterized protein BYT42DRAFT_326057 [Radiomyces spectabilis]KAI8379415.1 hypothetical protein BYT42DRAFT_326057 [Radiomyces spectabilis]
MLNLSLHSVDPLAEVPIILVHPISMDPPPNHYLTRRSVNHEHPAGVFLENFERLHQGDHGSLEINASRNSSTTIQISKPKPIRPLAAIRKSLIRWSRRLIQRTASLSSIMSTPSTIASHSTPFQLRIGNSMTPSSLRLSHQQTTTRPLSAVAACTAMPLRHGRIRPPKQFGHEPGALRNAGLDIRTKLDVSTAREAWEGFQAEIHDINGWKAPSEKCEIDYKKLSTASAIPEDGSSLHSAQKGILSPTQAANRHRAKSDIVRV